MTIYDKVDNIEIEPALTPMVCLSQECIFPYQKS